MASDIEVEKLRKKSLEVTGKLFDILDNEKLLVKNSRIVEKSFLNRFNRVYDMETSLDRRKKIFEDEEKFAEFLEKNKEYGITQENFMFDFRVSSTHFLLSLQELISTFLVEMLDVDTLKINKDKPMLGTTMKMLGDYRNGENKQVFLEDGLKLVFNVKMRNTIGHDKWWFDDNHNFCTEDGEIFSEEEFYGEIVSFSILMTSISINYMQRKFPDDLERLMSKISK